ncbi:MAG: dihydrolipoyl dehydrogenase [Methanobacteriota archaeon]|nr:MAG: dihydrolipoyl dehydrogenase [Euryarchaeota archaeon]
MALETEVLIIGAGPGGYPAAIRAAQLGKKVVIVDKGFLGGECLNWGCIPSKALISASKLYHTINHDAYKMGIMVEKSSINMEKLQEWKNGIVSNLKNGIRQLFKAHKIQYLEGTATLEGRYSAKIKLNDGKEETIRFNYCILATGASFISLPNIKIDEEKILSARGALALSKVPKHLVCIGGGVIGIELGTVFAKLGAKVSIIEFMPEILPGVEKRIVNVVKKKLKALGVEIYTSSEAKTVEILKTKMKLKVKTPKGEMQLEPDKILLSIGKRANTGSLGLEKAGIKTDEKGFIKVDKQLRTNVPHIFAIGDCTGGPFLAHRSTKHGIIAAEVLAGLKSEVDFVTIPTAIFSDPEIAVAGITEEEAKKKGMKVVTSRASFGASGRAMSQLETDGFVKLIADPENNVLLGAEIVGPHASDLISEIALALEMGATVEDVGYTVHPHPTLPEMIMEAAESIEGKAIHVPNVRKKK